MSVSMSCAECGETLARTLVLALLVDAGAKTRDPNYCFKSKDNEHVWVSNNEGSSD